MNQNFGFISFPDELTTGSSIMPHKKNPDVFELIRAKGNKLQALPNEIAMITANLPSGYHRDLQLLKECLFPAFEDINACLQMAGMMLKNVNIKENILDDNKYIYLFSVEELNKEVLNGTPFRDAYKKIAADIKEGSFKPDTKVNHTHEGSIGNLCNAQIANKMNAFMNDFQFVKVEESIAKLLQVK
jgi:argininosuccinate lyase